MPYRDVWPDASGRLFRPGETVYVVDVDRAWPAVFVGYKDDEPYVQTPGGEYLKVEKGTLRRSAVKPS